MACEREDWAFMLVLPTLRERTRTLEQGLCCTMCRVKMACEREDWAFMLVLPTLRERAPRLRQASVWEGEGRRGKGGGGGETGEREEGRRGKGGGGGETGERGEGRRGKGGGEMGEREKVEGEGRRGKGGGGGKTGERWRGREDGGKGGGGEENTHTHKHTHTHTMYNHTHTQLMFNANTLQNTCTHKPPPQILSGALLPQQHRYCPPAPRGCATSSPKKQSITHTSGVTLVAMATRCLVLEPGLVLRLPDVPL